MIESDSHKEAARKCCVCASEIPKAAIKCTICNSFQDWRRHISVSNSALALLVALVAVIGPTAQSLWTVYLEQRHLNSKTLNLAVIEISDAHVGALVSNQTAETIVITSIQCLIHPPYDQEYWRKYNDGATATTIKWPLAKDTIGTVLVTYLSPNPIVLASNEQIYSVLFSRHITPAGENSMSMDEEAKNLCSIGAKNAENSLEANAVILDVSSVFQFDALTITETADYRLDDERRQSLIEEIKRRRGQ